MKTEGSQPVALHLDTMRRDQELPSPRLPLSLWAGVTDITQVPGQVLLNLQLRGGGEWAELAGKNPNNLHRALTGQLHRSTLIPLHGRRALASHDTCPRLYHATVPLELLNALFTDI